MTHTGRPPPSSSSSVGREALDHVTVADELVGHDLAAPVDHRPAHDGDALRHGLGRRRAEVAVDALPAVARSGTERVSTVCRLPSAWMRRTTPFQPIGLSSLWVSSPSERPSRSSMPNSFAPAGLEYMSVPVIVAGPHPVLGGLDERPVGRQRVELAHALGEPRAQVLALGLQPRPLAFEHRLARLARAHLLRGDHDDDHEHDGQHDGDDHARDPCS